MAGIARIVGLFFLLCFFTVVVVGSSLVWLLFSLLRVGFSLAAMIAGLLLIASPVVIIVFAVRRIRSGVYTSQPHPVASSNNPPASTIQSQSTKQQLILEAEAKVDQMRTHARRITKPAVRTQTLEICALADRVLAILPESADERMIRESIDRYFSPAESLISQYARLAAREVETASATLRQVETNDLPLIERRLHDLYNRLNRGDIIDLEVTREMLHFDLPVTS